MKNDLRDSLIYEKIFDIFLALILAIFLLVFFKQCSTHVENIEKIELQKQLNNQTNEQGTKTR